MRFIATAILSYAVYLLLSVGSGETIVWDRTEFAIGAVFALIVAGLLSRANLISPRVLNPLRWIRFLIYLFPFFFALAKANIDVAYRVFTGKINPGIVRISPGLKSDTALTLLANSITLTPGTLSVEVDEDNNDLFVHWINVDPGALKKKPVDHRAVSGSFADWVRKIAD